MSEWWWGAWAVVMALGSWRGLRDPWSDRRTNSEADTVRHEEWKP